MAVLKKIKRALRGDIRLTTVALEAIRRARVSRRIRKERAIFAKNADGLAATPIFRLSDEELLRLVREDGKAKFFSGFADVNAEVHRALFPSQTAELIASANRIVEEHCWPLLGFGEKCFGREIQWRLDPLSNYLWPLDYHHDITLIRGDGSDVRVLWELNRLGHFVTLARAYALTRDERYSAEFFSQLHSWDQQNPYGRGPNWTCAMEVALRVMNLLAAFEIFRKSPQLNPDFVKRLEWLFQLHGDYIRHNLEFSYIATSNHYLSDVAGLLWLGLMLPDYCDAESWRDFGLRQVLREMEKQVLADGADFESSTGYHRFVLELFLYSFLLCRSNGEEIEEKYWTTLHRMLIYLRCYLRPDGCAPLIGDTDSGQVLPIRRRRADDHAYLLAIGAVVFNDPGLKIEDMEPPEELFWLLGEEGVKTFQEMSSSMEYAVSRAFPDAGIYVVRHGDLYLNFNASHAGIDGRGSHGHNDALSIEVSAGGQAFIVDPGTYVYSADLEKRHEFRSTAFHSTVVIDGKEQNTTNRDTPFVIGNEARPRVLEWKTGDDLDKVVAEHYGYAPVVHRRSITFNKRERSWMMRDEFLGEGEHVYEVRFHFAPRIEVRVSGGAVEARVGETVLVIESKGEPVLESQPVSRDYGERSEAVSVCWRISGRAGKLVQDYRIFKIDK